MTSVTTRSLGCLAAVLTLPLVSRVGAQARDSQQLAIRNTNVIDVRAGRVIPHKPHRVSTIEASEAGQQSVEHIQSLQADCWSGADAFRSDPAPVLSPAILQRMTAEYDVSICGRIIQTLVKNHTWFVPTHVVRRSEAYAQEHARGQDPRARFVTPERWSRWVDRAIGAA